ncbi:MAG: type II secretion system protein GspM [Steroidobacteraceae bacterium]
MNAWLAKLAAWYDGLAARERLAVSWGAAAAVLILVGGALLSLHQNVERSAARLLRKQHDLAFVQAATAEILAAGPVSTASAGNEPLVVLADRATRQAGLVESLSGSEAAPDGSLRTSFRGVAFDALAGMVASLGAQANVTVQSAEIESTGEPGKVNATMVLRSPAAP